MHRTWKTTRRASAAVLASALLLLAGCSGSDEPDAADGDASPTAADAPSESEQPDETVSESPEDTANGAVEAAASATDEARQSPGFVAPGPDVDPSEAEGKTLWVIDVASSIPLTQVTDAAAAEALGLVGAEVVRFDGAGQVSEFARGVNQAILEQADAIALFAINPELVAGPVQQAQDAGIPVIAIQYGDPGASLPTGIAAQTTYCYSCAGETMANWIVTDTAGEAAGVNLIVSEEVTNATPLVEGFTAALEAGCPDCTIQSDNVPVADWQSAIETQVSSNLTSDSDIKYVVPIYDGMALFAIPAISKSGRDDVKIVTFNASQGVMQNLADGGPVVAEVGSPQAWEGWALADQFIRLMAGVDPLVEQGVSLRLFDSQNIGEITLDDPERTWYGVDFESVYKSMWGVE